MKKVTVRVLGIAAVAALGVSVVAPAQAAAPTVTIGVVEMLTGGSAFYGQSVLEGIKVAQAELNAKGGILGKKVVLSLKDNASDNAQTTSLITALGNDKTIPVVIPPTYQPNFNAACSAATATNLPLVSAQSGPPAPAGNSKGLCWTMTADLGSQTAFTMKALKAKGLKKFAVVYDQDNGYVSWVRSDPWKTAFDGFDVKQIGVAKGTTDFGPQVTQLLAGGYDAVFPFFTIEDAAPFITQARAGGYTGKFFDPVSQLTSLRLATLAPKSVGLLAATPQSATDVPSFAKFVSAYKSQFKKTLDDPTYTGYGYDALKLIASAMTKAGTTTDRAKINKAITGIKAGCYSICFAQGTAGNAGAYLASKNYLTQLTAKTGYVRVK
jgi:branched-chain amino acid transport system substrate-binding protein